MTIPTTTVNGRGETDHLEPADTDWMELYDSHAERMNVMLEAMERRELTVDLLTTEQREFMALAMDNQVSFRAATATEQLANLLGTTALPFNPSQLILLQMPDGEVVRVFKTGPMQEGTDWVWASADETYSVGEETTRIGELVILPVFDSSSCDIFAELPLTVHLWTGEQRHDIPIRSFLERL